MSIRIRFATVSAMVPGLSEVTRALREALELLGERWRAFGACVLLAHGAGELAALGLRAAVEVAGGGLHPAAAARAVEPLTTLLLGALVLATADRLRRGLRAGPVALVAGAARLFVRLVPVALLALAGVAGAGLVFLFPGVLLAARWSLAPAVVAVERPPVRAALAQSFRLTSGVGAALVVAGSIAAAVDLALVSTLPLALAAPAGGAPLAARLILGVARRALHAVLFAALFQLYWDDAAAARA